MHKVAKKKEHMKKNLRKPPWHLNVCNILHTLAITLMGLSLQFVIAISIALLLTRPFQGKGFFRTIVLTPLGIPTIVSATIMTYIFDTSGYLNEVLYKLGLLGEVPIDWAQGGGCP